MIPIDDMTEADEAATNKEIALDNLRAQIRQGETIAVIDMYERAAWTAGATVGETDAVFREIHMTKGNVR